jgi:hypothetical protein
MLPGGSCERTPVLQSDRFEILFACVSVAGGEHRPPSYFVSSWHRTPRMWSPRKLGPCPWFRIRVAAHPVGAHGCTLTSGVWISRSDARHSPGH